MWPHPTTHPSTHTPTHGWGSHQRCQIFKQNWNILIHSSFIQFQWFDLTPPIDPPKNLYTHPQVGGLQNHKSSNTIELVYLKGQDLLNFLVISHDQPINPPTHQTICLPIGEGFSTDFKSLNRIKISQFFQHLLSFYWFGFLPLGSEWWLGRLGVDGGNPPTSAHAHADAYTCMLNMINMDASVGVAICNFYTCIYVYMCATLIYIYFSVAHMYMQVCMCMHVGCVSGTPKHTHIHSNPSYTCRSQGPQITKNAIKLEWIKII